MNWLHRRCRREQADALELEHSAYEMRLQDMRLNVDWWRRRAEKLEARVPVRCGACHRFKKRGYACACVTGEYSK
jgi:hypothetical protein